MSACLSAYAGTVQDETVARDRAENDGVNGWAVVNVSAAYLRAAPDYESALETQELMGRPVRVVAKDRYWVKAVTSQPYTAWVNEMALAFMTEDELAEYEAAPKYMVTAMHSAVWTSPSKGARQLCDLVAGDLLRVDIQGKRVRGYVPVILPDGRKGWTDDSHVCLYDRLREAQAKLGDGQAGRLAVEKALEYAGVPYLWGGMSSSGVDCSGLVRLSYMLGAGIMLPRNASQQYACGVDIPLFRGEAADCRAEGTGENSADVDSSAADNCQGKDRAGMNGAETGVAEVDFSALRPGDLLFFGPLRADGSRGITHVGIYIGDGRMIHASQVVRINSLRPGDADCYENACRLHKACRIAAPAVRIVK